MPLAALTLALGGPELLFDIQRQLDSPAPGDCVNPPEHANVELGLSGRTLYVGEAGRILFSLPWRLRKDEARPLVEDRRGNRAVPLRKVPLLTIISASALLDTKEVPGPGGALDGSIVVIGGSYFDAHDLHATPVGQMPGALVLLNAINTALQFPEEGSLRPAPWWLKWLSEIVVIVIVAFIFTFRALPIVFATLLSMLLAVVLILVVGRLWIASGILIGIAAPVIGIVIHKWHAELHNASPQNWRLVLRAIKFWERHHE